MSAKRKILWTIVTLFVAVLTVATVFSHSESLSFSELWSLLGTASPLWLTVTFVCMTGFIVFEALALLCILRQLDCRRGFLHGLLYSAGDLYFSAITPSATGGQPASGFFMARDKVPGAAITATLVLNLILYNAATLVIGLVCLFLRFDLFLRFSTLSKVFIIFSFAALLCLVLLFYGLLRREAALSRVGNRCILILFRMHLVKDQERWVGRLEKMVEDYRICVQELSGKTRVVCIAFAYNLLQRIFQISVTLTLFLALGGALGSQAVDLWFIQAFAQIGSNCIPIPGGMGAADYLMLDGFQMLFTSGFAFQLQAMSRGISFYLCTLLSGLIVLIGSLTRCEERKDEGEISC